MCAPILGAIVSGIGAAMQVSQANKQAEMQAQLDERQAEVARMKGSYEATRKQDEIARVKGAQRAALAANGLALNTGSAAEVQRDTDTEANLDVAAIRWNSASAADMHEFQAKVDRAAAPGGAAAALAFVAPVIKAWPADGNLMAA